MDGSEYRRNSPGPASQLTLEQVLHIRAVYATYDAARRERRRIQKELDLTPDEFCRYAKGQRGKKFKSEAA